MPWWSWLLIWSALTFALLGLLLWFAVSLYRKALRALRALEAVSGQVAELTTDSSLEPETFRPAVFTDLTLLHDSLTQQRAERAHRRQVRRDEWIVRGKLMRKGR